jgi:hypothetical protein
MTQWRDALDFLQWLRPNGSWLLTAIIPDGKTTTREINSEVDLQAFILLHNNKRNLYLGTNPTRKGLVKKAAKIDVVAIEFVLADLDPADGETPEAAKTRYLQQLESFEPKPSAVIDSGNGIQCLWRLQPRIDLGKLVEVESDEKIIHKFAEDDQKNIDDIEARTAALMARLGGTRGTQNIDRVLRLPGTTNLPNSAKRKAGRVACQAKLLYANGAACSVEDFPVPEPESEKPPSGSAKEKPGDEEWWSGEIDEIESLIGEGGAKPSRSEVVWRVVNGLLRGGRAPEAIVAILLDRANGISVHIYDQADPAGYAKKQVASAITKLKFAADKEGSPFNSQNNVRIALVKMGVTLRYNQFADQILISGLNGFGPLLNDAAIDRLWLQIELRYRIAPRKERFTTIVMDAARGNGFHPVKDYLDGLKWDGTQRIDRWLTTYCGAKSTPYVDAVGALWLMAAVRRVREAGCKFDEMPIFEGDQGTERSTMLRIIAVRGEWFADDLPMLARGKEVIEMLRGKWIIESPEIKGLRRGDVEQLKAFMSRQSDRGRLAYDRITSDVPRHCVFAGTTNEEEYLKDNTGNRRYWPVRMGAIKLDDLKRDRDQLWAEAAAREREGASIRLARKLCRRRPRSRKRGSRSTLTSNCYKPRSAI